MGVALASLAAVVKIVKRGTNSQRDGNALENREQIILSIFIRQGFANDDYTSKLQ